MSPYSMEIQIKTAMRHHSAPIRTLATNADKGLEQKEFLLTTAGTQSSTSSQEGSLAGF